MQEITIWHNEKCSKSRNALSVLESKDINLKVIKYLETCPNKKEIENVLSLLEMNAKDLMRKGETIYKELNLNDVSDESILIQAMVDNPILIERPVIIKGDKAVIARPIENIEKL